MTAPWKFLLRAKDWTYSKPSYKTILSLYTPTTFWISKTNIAFQYKLAKNNNIHQF